MLPKNVYVMREYEKQSRERLQQEAQNARRLPRHQGRQDQKLNFPAWEFTLEKFRTLRMRFNPSS